MALAVNIVVVVHIPVSISLCTLFAELITLCIALLLHIVRSMLEVTFNSELPHIVSFSSTKGCMALISNGILCGIGNNCLYGNDGCYHGLRVFNNVSLTWFVVVLSCLTAPSVNSAVAVLSVLILNTEVVELIE